MSSCCHVVTCALRLAARGYADTPLSWDEHHSCRHAFIPSCLHAVMLSCRHGAPFMPPCFHAVMPPCRHAAMPPCRHATPPLREIRSLFPSWLVELREGRASAGLTIGAVTKRELRECRDKPEDRGGVRGQQQEASTQRLTRGQRRFQRPAT